MIDKNDKKFEMQAYLEACGENGIALKNTNNKVKPDIIIVSEDGNKYSVSEDMSVSVISRNVHRKALRGEEWKKAISRQDK